MLASSTTHVKGNLKVWLKDAKLAASLPFRSRNGQIEALSQLSGSMNVRGMYNLAFAKSIPSQKRKLYASMCLAISAKIDIKLAKLYASQGKYDNAILKCTEACAFLKKIGKSQLLPMAWEEYYKGKICEKMGKDFLLAAAHMEVSHKLFLQAKKTMKALSIMEEAISVLERCGYFKEAQQKCESMAAYHVNHNNFLEAARFFNMASEMSQDKEMAFAYTTLADKYLEIVNRAQQMQNLDTFPWQNIR